MAVNGVNPNMSFKPPEVGVIDPSGVQPVSINRIVDQTAKEHSSSNQGDSFHKSSATQQSPTPKTIIGGLAAAAVACILLKNKICPGKIISNVNDLNKYKTKLITSLTNGVLKNSQMQDVQIRLVNQKPKEVRTALSSLYQTALEMSHCKEITPKLQINFSKISEDERDAVMDLLKDGRVDQLPDSMLQKVESAELKSLNLSKFLNESTDIVCDVKQRNVIDKQSGIDSIEVFAKNIRQGILNIAVRE